MKCIKNIIALLFLSFLFTTCIDELDIDTEDTEDILVIEGSVNTMPGPHRILISKSAKYGSILDDAIQKISDATVQIRDEEGQHVFLEEIRPGEYETPSAYKAEVGKKYTLSITLANGERYISTTEEVVSAPAIDSVIYNYDLGIEAFAQWRDPADEDNFYLLEADGVFINNTRPDLFVGRDFFGNPAPAPKDCCARCWVIENNVDKEIRLFKDNLSNGNVNTELAAFIPDDRMRFMEKYMVAVKLSSLTKEAFQFLNLVKEQLSIEGNIFDPPPATIRGNMINLDNPDAPVIGYFRASDVKTDTIYILNTDLVDPLNVELLPDDCRVLENSSTSPPPYWE